MLADVLIADDKSLGKDLRIWKAKWQATEDAHKAMDLWSGPFLHSSLACLQAYTVTPPFMVTDCLTCCLSAQSCGSVTATLLCHALS